MNTVDARGLLCPEPVVLAQKAIKGAPAEVTVLVDAVAAKENVTRFAKSRGYEVESSEENGEYSLKLTKK